MLAKLEAEGWERPQQASGGEIIEWAKGKTVIGRFLGIKKLPDRADQAGGHLMTVATDEGNQVYGCPTLLFQTIEHWEINTVIRVECLGKVVPTSRGMKAWDFIVTRRV